MRFRTGTKGVVSTTEIVGISIAILMIAIIIPIALNEIGSATTTTASENWGTSRDVLVVLIATVIPILAVLGIAMKFI